MKSGSPEAREVGARIKAAAQSAGLSLQDLGRHIGVSRPTIYAYAAGTLRVSAQRLKQIAEVTGQSGSYFSPKIGSAETRRPLEELVGALLSNANLTRAIELVSKEVELAAASGRQYELAGVQKRLGNALLLDGDYLEAVGHLQAARSGFLARHQAAEASACSQSLGYAFINTGRLDRARSCFDEAIAHLAPDQRWKGEVSLAALAERTGHLADAKSRLDRLLADEMLPPAARTYVIANLASLHAAAGRWLESEALNRTALSGTSGTTDQNLERFLQIGRCLLRQGRLEESSLWLARASDGAHLLGDKARQGYAGLLQARLLFIAGYLADARLLALRWQREAILHEHRRSEAEARLLLSEIAYSKGEDETAQDYAAQLAAFCEANQYPILAMVGRAMETAASGHLDQDAPRPARHDALDPSSLGSPLAWQIAAHASVLGRSDPASAARESTKAIALAEASGDLLMAAAERKRLAVYLVDSGESEGAKQQTRECDEFSERWSRQNIHCVNSDGIETKPVLSPTWTAFGNP
ncbi:MAG TPA: helix-turn-helix domain-containing protein [Fimbriimonadaceae bacterium]|nr:helix-turn-helix domain-containing protein [Fimbriimonadaceae bacterium]HRJ95251.1 helix-turn-helix domain-containing protein [Fimbriimonadaceae bacterium]